ncbi:MAG: hypothetical protein MK231_00295 [Pelagibacterales bacterium]|nr:hypothetical protein [Pelagibacterales bacterium]
MFWQILTFQPESTILHLHIGVENKSGGKIAVLIIISTLILLSVANWIWKKYISNNK